MHHRTPRALAAAAALALTLGACSDVPTGAPARLASAGPAAHTVSASGVTLIPNTVKYRDNGGKPATGRSGSAALRAFALQGKDGVTELSLEAASADPWDSWTRGTITRAHVRALDSDSTPMFSLNRTHIDAASHREQLTGLIRGQYLRVQANVTGIDPHRTDVVTVTERVKRRPDMAVTLGQIAPQVPSYQPVPIYATIAELNGDVGARLVCRLLVNGVFTDGAYGVWVDAGDAVTCAFTRSFSPGAYDIQVDVAGVQPADWDEANNRSALVRIEAASGPTEFKYDAQVSATRESYVTWSESRWRNTSTGTAGESRSESGSSSHTQFAEIVGWTSRPLSGRATFQVSQTTGGRVVHADTWTAPEDEPCMVHWSRGASLFVCYDMFSEMYFSYSWSASAVTYHSSGYGHEWDETTGEDVYYYHYNDSQGDGDILGFGDDYAFRVRVTSGDAVLTAESDFALERTESGWSDSWCIPWAWWVDGFGGEGCEATEQKTETWTGKDSN